MATTEAQRLRRMLGDRIPPGGTDASCFFSNDEIDDLIEVNNSDLNAAAYEGWLQKSAEFAKLVDQDLLGANRKLSQMFKNAEAMAEHYGKFVGESTTAIVGRVVGRAISLREDCRPRVMATSATHRLGQSEPSRAIMRNSQPDTTEEDPTYPAISPQAGA